MQNGFARLVYTCCCCLSGLDVHRPVVYEHSKKLLGNLIILLACKGDTEAACEARLIQRQTFAQSPSLLSLCGDGPVKEKELQRCGSLGSIADSGATKNSLSVRVCDLIQLIAVREAHRNHWPFVYHSTSRNNPDAEVAELSALVEQILLVFQHCLSEPLKEKWAKTALQVGGLRHVLYVYLNM